MDEAAAIPTLSLRRYSSAEIAAIRGLLEHVYAEVYSDRLREHFLSIEQFRQRLAGHLSFPNWEAVVGYVGDQPIGYAYGGSRRAGSSFWNQVVPTPDDEYAHETGRRTFALFELMVRAPWRKTGASRLIHDELLNRRTEERVCLFVEHDHPRVRALYQSWGYVQAGTSQPAADAPLYDVMVLALKR
jgi:hypothetical protein